MSGFTTPTLPNLTDYTTFLQNEGFGAVVLPPTSSWIPVTYNIALGVVNQTINQMFPNLYVLAVYNLGADSLINYAQDVEGQNFFKVLREKYKIHAFSAGVVASTGDAGSNTSLLNPDQLKRLTLANLQQMKTPYGRAYMGIAQSYGPTIWGLT